MLTLRIAEREKICQGRLPTISKYMVIVWQIFRWEARGEENEKTSKVWGTFEVCGRQGQGIFVGY
jgi:hypothetical protein